MRPKQWLKNVLVLAAPLAAGSLFEPSVLGPSLVAFLAFCLISSSMYLLNDARDVEQDRLHHSKRHRPIAAGQLSIVAAMAAAAVLGIAALVIAWLVRPELAAVIAAYAACTSLYSLLLKHEPVIELGLLSLGFLLRAIAGGVAADIPISQWFLIVAGFGSLFVAAGKRASELHWTLQAQGDPAAITRRTLAGYTPTYLRFVWTVSAGVTITAYCLWAFEVGQRQTTVPWAVWSVVPFVLALLRYGVIIDRGEAEAPEDAILHDRLLLALGAAWVALFALGAFGV